MASQEEVRRRGMLGFISAILMKKKPRHVLGDPITPRYAYSMMYAGFVSWRLKEGWLELLEGRTAEDLMCL